MMERWCSAITSLSILGLARFVLRWAATGATNEHRPAPPTKHGRPWRAIVYGKCAELLPPASVRGIGLRRDGIFFAVGRTIDIAGDRWMPLAFDEAGILVTHPRWWDAGYVWRMQPVGLRQSALAVLDVDREPENPWPPSEWRWLLQRLDL